MRGLCIDRFAQGPLTWAGKLTLAALTTCESKIVEDLIWQIFHEKCLQEKAAATGADLTHEIINTHEFIS